MAVIDDDAYDGDIWNSKELKVHPEYQGLIKRCNEDAILCHLQFYPKKREGDPTDDFFRDHFQRAVNIARNADIVILDWHLGTNKEEHAIKLLQELEEDSSLRFVIIYSAFAQSVNNRLEPKGFIYHPGGSESTLNAAESANGDIPGFLSKNGNIFVLVRQKPQAATDSSSRLFDSVYDLLTLAFPDLLQWAGLDIGSNIKDYVPALIGKLPRSVDSELALQIFNKSMPNEIAAQITDLFMQDLTLMLLKDVHTSIINDASMEKMLPTSLQNKLRSSNQRQTARKQIESEVEAYLDENSRTTPTLPGLNLTSLVKITAYIESYASINTAYSTPLTQGAILSKDGKYYLCIEPICDLYRMQKGSNISFIVGESISEMAKTGKQKFVQSSIQTENGPINIKWDLTDIQQIRLSKKYNGFPIIGQDDLSGYTLVAMLRNDVFQRILHRTWTHRSRVGIDIIEAVRLIRGET